HQLQPCWYFCLPFLFLVLRFLRRLLCPLRRLRCCFLLEFPCLHRRLETTSLLCLLIALARPCLRARGPRHNQPKLIGRKSKDLPHWPEAIYLCLLIQKAILLPLIPLWHILR